MDDIQLLREYVGKNSEAAFTQLVEHHLDLVYSAALRRVGGDHHRAQEVTQMVFTDLARKAARLQHHPLLAGWLHRSTRWAAATLRRAEQRRIASEQAAATDPLVMSVAEPVAEWEKLSPLLDHALDSLGEADRDAVLLRYFNDRPFAEIGATLGLSENAARMRVERDLARLQALLKKRGVTSTSAALGLALAHNAVAAAPAGTAATLSTTALGAAATAGASSLLTYFLMTKLQLTLAGTIALALTVSLTLQTIQNRNLQNELADLQSRLAATRSASTGTRNQVAQLETKLQQLDDAIAKQSPPLTPEQQERVRLDTLVRKGELDMEYASLFRRLKLTPEPLDKLKALIVERNQAVYDATKLAQAEGLEPASLSELRTLGNSATGEIDSRIAMLLGSAGYATFREYIDLQPYRLWATGLVRLEYDETSSFAQVQLSDRFDKQSDDIARLLATTAQNYLDEKYRAKLWPVAPPPELREALAKVLSKEALHRYDQNIEMEMTRRRMFEIARDAALQGKLKLSKSSARDYPAPNQNQSPSAK